ncbi:hypothetical protein DPMN_036459 [Dreissena polymorpha]|uniref:Uncharacterized protein n=1 Tax=Dreissena polymorpha TaxID=45954 RepID=A0A9D4M9G7_DREPO|nr:hypothetical protein DPMN_036459 [Dreissena polymorpha]
MAPFAMNRLVSTANTTTTTNASVTTIGSDLIVTSVFMVTTVSRTSHARVKMDGREVIAPR